MPPTPSAFASHFSVFPLRGRRLRFAAHTRQTSDEMKQPAVLPRYFHAIRGKARRRRRLGRRARKPAPIASLPPPAPRLGRCPFKSETPRPQVCNTGITCFNHFFYRPCPPPMVAFGNCPPRPAPRGPQPFSPIMSNSCPLGLLGTFLPNGLRWVNHWIGRTQRKRQAAAPPPQMTKIGKQ